MHRIIVILIFSFSLSASIAQSKKGEPKREEKPVPIFTVNKIPVPVGEFVYLYKKNHQADSSEFTKEKISEYLDLFINFKLKVEEAKRRGMDTTQAFKQEFATYRNELLKPYLPESKIVDSLVLLTYNRMKEEVKASHILIGIKQDATPTDTLAALKKIMEIRQHVLAGEDFGVLATAYSEDPSAKTNHGNLGYFTAMQMVHPFETAAYTTPVGQVSNPVRTTFGYHLVKVADRKPARGEVEVSHIMIRRGEGIDEEKAKATIFEVYDQLRAGAAWEELCKQYSEDQSSKSNGGRIRPFGVGAMASVPEFDQVAFSLQKPGEFSDPFTTAFGWHIVRLERKIPIPALQELMPTLKNRVARDERLRISKQAWKTKLKKEFQFIANESVKSNIISLVDSTLQEGRWNPRVPNSGNEVLITLHGKPFTVGHFLSYAKKNQQAGADDPKVIFNQLYESYVESLLITEMEMKITDQNPDFKFLMNEYYEGILLFEIMEKEVWNKAVQDSVGLKDFYNKNKSRYQAGERAVAEFYSSASLDILKPLKESLEKTDTLTVATYLGNHPELKQESGAYEKSEKTILSKVGWSKGIYSTENNGMYYIVFIRNILPPGPKTFEEAKASVVGDYQQELEKLWLVTLRKKYPVKVNEKNKRNMVEKLQK